MIKLVGKTDCKTCEEVKLKLKNRNIEFEYEDLNNMNTKDKSKIMIQARKAKQMGLPIIFKENVIVGLEEIICDTI